RFDKAEIVDVQLRRLPAAVHARAPPPTHLPDVQRTARAEPPGSVHGRVGGRTLRIDDGGHDRALDVVDAILGEEIEIDAAGVGLAGSEFPEYVAIRGVQGGRAHHVESLEAAVELPPEPPDEIAREAVSVLQQVVRLSLAGDVGRG